MASFAHLMLPILCIRKNSQVNDHTGLTFPNFVFAPLPCTRIKKTRLLFALELSTGMHQDAFPETNRGQKMSKKWTTLWILSQDEKDPSDERWSIAHGCLDVAGYALMRRTERQLGSWWKERPSAHSILNWPWPYQFVLAAICGLLCHAACCLLMCHRLPSENSHGLGKWNLNRVGTCWYDGTECGSRQCSRCCEDSKLCIVPLCSTKLHADLSTHFFKSKYPHALADVWDYMIYMLQDHYVVSR